MSFATRIDYASLADLDLAAACVGRDREAVRQVTIANNQRLFRAAWSILKDRQEAEDAVQAGYLKAFAAMDRFAGRSSLSTWLTRIVVNEALARVRSNRRRSAHLQSQGVTMIETWRDNLANGSKAATPDAALAREQLRGLLERAIAELPDAFRTVFVLRQVEGLSVEETAEALGIAAATVKTRSLRARRKLQDMLAPEIRSALVGTFPFAGADCEAMTERVLAAFPER